VVFASGFDAQDSAHHASQPSRPSWRRVLLGYPSRLTAYGVTSLAIAQLAFWAVDRYSIGFIAAENGPVEQVQVLLAVFACAAFFYAASRLPVGRTGLILCACMVGYAAARESDAWFDRVFFEDAYKYLVGVPLLAIGLAASYAGRHVVVGESLALVRTPAVTIFAIGGIYICSVCQVFDRPGFWAALHGAEGAEQIKAGVEEFSEFFGYLLLGFSGVEAIVMSIRPRVREAFAAKASAAESEPGLKRAA